MGSVLMLITSCEQVIYAGDSAADEIAIERLKGVAYTFRVINEDADVITKTAADYRLAGIINILKLNNSFSLPYI